MIHAQNCKNVLGLAPISVNGAITPLTCDTLGYYYALCTVSLGVVNTGAFTALRIVESATDFSAAAVGGNYTSVGTTGDGRLPQTADAGKIFVFGLPMGGVRKRYLQCEATTGGVTLISVNWQLFRGNITPNTSTERGVASAIFA